MTADSRIMVIPGDQRYLDVVVRALIVDPNSRTPVLILQGEHGGDILPIWIGDFEAQSIALAMEKIQPPRPMTHDLLQTVIETLGFSVTGVRIHSLDDGVFKASIDLADSSGETTSRPVELDARPSDAVALALRTASPIRMAETVFNESRLPEPDLDEALKTFLENLDPADLGDYEM